MSIHPAGLWVALITTTLSSNTAIAQAPKTVSLSTNAIDKLVIGDQYTLLTKRGDIQLRFSGELVKANDHWIVLQNASEYQFIDGVPTAREIPLSIEMSLSSNSVYLWIPRDATTILGRVRATNRPKVVALTDDSPPLGRGCDAQFVSKGKVAHGRGLLGELTDQYLTINIDRVEYVSQPLPVLGSLPLVGSVFSTTKDHVNKARHQYTHEGILCVYVSASEASAGKKPSSK